MTQCCKPYSPKRLGSSGSCKYNLAVYCHLNLNRQINIFVENTYKHRYLLLIGKAWAFLVLFSCLNTAFHKQRDLIITPDLVSVLKQCFSPHPSASQRWLLGKEQISPSSLCALAERQGTEFSPFPFPDPETDVHCN